MCVPDSDSLVWICDSDPFISCLELERAPVYRDIWVSHVTNMNQFCHTYEWDHSLEFERASVYALSTYMSEPCHIHARSWFIHMRTWLVHMSQVQWPVLGVSTHRCDMTHSCAVVTHSYAFMTHSHVARASAIPGVSNPTRDMTHLYAFVTHSFEWCITRTCIPTKSTFFEHAWMPMSRTEWLISISRTLWDICTSRTQWVLHVTNMHDLPISETMHTHTYTHTHTCTHAHTHTRIHAHMHTRTHAHIPTHTYTYARRAYMYHTFECALEGE